MAQRYFVSMTYAVPDDKGRWVDAVEHEREITSLRAEVERLTRERDEAAHGGNANAQLYSEAADQIVRLEQKLSQARDALDWIAYGARNLDDAIGKAKYALMKTRGALNEASDD